MNMADAPGDTVAKRGGWTARSRSWNSCACGASLR